MQRSRTLQRCKTKPETVTGLAGEALVISSLEKLQLWRDVPTLHFVRLYEHQTFAAHAQGSKVLKMFFASASQWQTGYTTVAFKLSVLKHCLLLGLLTTLNPFFPCHLRFSMGVVFYEMWRQPFFTAMCWEFFATGHAPSISLMDPARPWSGPKCHRLSLSDLTRFDKICKSNDVTCFAFETLLYFVTPVFRSFDSCMVLSIFHDFLWSGYWTL